MKNRAQYNHLITCIRKTGVVMSERPGGSEDQNPSHSFHMRLDGDDFTVAITPERMEDGEGETEAGPS